MFDWSRESWCVEGGLFLFMCWAHWADNGTKEAINLSAVMAGYGCFLFFSPRMEERNGEEERLC